MDGRVMRTELNVYTLFTVACEDLQQAETNGESKSAVRLDIRCLNPNSKAGYELIRYMASLST